MHALILLTMVLPSSALSVFPSVFLLFSSLVSTLSINSSLSAELGAGYSLGINCRGSILCPAHLEAFPPDYIGTLVEITDGTARFCPSDFSCGPLNDTDIYLPKAHIVCLPLGQSFLGGICAFTQGSNVPATGVTGALVKTKLLELRGHGCRVCGSVPLGGGNDPHSQGILTVNYINSVACKGLCPSTHYNARLQSPANESSLPAISSLLLES